MSNPPMPDSQTDPLQEPARRPQTAAPGDPLDDAIKRGRMGSAGTGMETTDGLGTGAGEPGVSAVTVTHAPDEPTRTPTIRSIPETERSDNEG
jgi:hypothetical protein